MQSAVIFPSVQLFHFKMNTFLSLSSYNSINLQAFPSHFYSFESSQTRCSTWYWKHKKTTRETFFFFFFASEKSGRIFFNLEQEFYFFDAVHDANYSRKVENPRKKREFKIKFGIFKVQFKFLVQLQKVAINFHSTPWQIEGVLRLNKLATCYIRWELSSLLLSTKASRGLMKIYEALIFNNFSLPKKAVSGNKNDFSSC